MKNILFYITGHGYGHATREIEILKKLTALGGEYFCHIKTNAPEWLFNLNLKRNFRYNYFFHDIGVVQSDWLTVDKETTLAAFSELWQDRRMIINREMEYIKKHNINLIVADIAPIAFEIAVAAKLPAIAIGNFSWDWIYEPYVEELPQFKHLIPQIKDAYHQANTLLRLPFAGDMSAFKNPQEVPLVGRKALREAEDVRRSLSKDIDPDKRLIIIAFRADDLSKIKLQNLEKYTDVHFGIFVKKYEHLNNIIYFPHDFMPFQELVNAADGVVSKPGYGIVSECIVNQTPLFFTERYDFQEYDYLKAGILENQAGSFLPIEDFVNGNWQSFFDYLDNHKEPWPEIATNGVEVIVAEILKYLSN